MLWPWITDLALLGGTDCDNSHQPYFASAGAQEAWFLGKVIDGMRFDNYTQLDTAKGIRVQGDYDKLLSVDMITFVCNNFSPAKRIYAKVVRKEWLNANCTVIYAEVAAFQTFMFDIEFTECFVEREHQEDDWNGGVPSYNNLIPESYSTGPCTDMAGADLFTSYNEQTYCVATVADPDGNTQTGTVTNGYFSGLRIATGTASVVQSLILVYNTRGKSDNIIAVFQAPTNVYNNVTSNLTPFPSTFTGINGYQPQNAKCYTYPYYYGEISNNQGGVSQYRFELFNDPNSRDFIRHNCFNIDSSCTIAPLQYAGESENFDQALTLPCGVQCAWAGDSYAAWQAQNSAKNTFKLLGSILGLGVAAAKGSPLGAVASLSGAASVAASTIDAQNLTNSAKGNMSGPIEALQANKLGFTSKIMAISADDAERLDKYFDAYGYATNTAKEPNLRTRPYWNYIKTRDVHVHTSFDYGWAQQIEAMFNSGVTLWHVDAGAVIGDYSMDNRG